MALIDKASLLMVPSVYEDGTLYNVLPSGNKAPDETGNHNGYDQTRADFTFSRGFNLTATRVNASGLIEKGRENLLLQSNQFDTTWASASTTETGGQTDKDGGTNAWLLTSSSATSGRISQSKSVSGVQTLSIYAKAGSLNWVRLYPQASTLVQAWFDLQNGVVGTTSSNNIDAKIESVGDGWYRCSITSNITLIEARIYPSSGDGISGGIGSIYIQDAQLELGLVSTPVIRTGATTATAGVLENTPRIDYSSGAGALLLEPQRTNLIPNSEYISATFTPVNSSFTANSGISPEGVQNSTAVNVTSVTNGYCYYSVSSATAGVEYVFSAYYKGVAGQTLRMRTIYDGNTTEKLITFTGNWQREEVSVIGGSGSTLVYLYDGRLGNLNAIDFEVYGAQLEAGSHVSSYVPTYGSAATRGADSCSVTGASDVIGQTEGTLFAEIEKFADGYWYLTISDGSSSNWIFIGEDQGKMRGYVRTSAGVQTDNRSADLSVGVHKMAIAYKLNDVAIYLDGAQVFTDSAADMPTLLDKISLTAAAAGVPTSQTLKGALKQYALFNERLSNTELAALTA